jgi:plastocyanin
MHWKSSIPRLQWFGALILCAIIIVCCGSYIASALAPHVSQAGRTFQPGELSIARGEAVQIVNDDADLLHHAYIASDKFSFDSGDQLPGSTTIITFPVAGVFQVLCAIHPKMKLVVTVK